MTRQELDRRFARARELEKNGKYSEALSDLLDLIDNHRRTRNFQAADLIQAVSEIVEIAEHLPDAKKALRIRRSRWEKSILSGDGEMADLRDIHFLNDMLEQPEQNRVFLAQLSHLRPVRQEMYEQFLGLVWKDFASAGHYTELESCIDEQTHQILSLIVRAQVRWDFSTNAEQRDADQEMLEHLLPDAVLVYETLVSLGKNTIAEKLAWWVVGCEALPNASALFIAAANKLGGPDAAEALNQAIKSLSIVPNSGNAVGVSSVPNSGTTSKDF